MYQLALQKLGAVELDRIAGPGKYRNVLRRKMRPSLEAGLREAEKRENRMNLQSYFIIERILSIIKDALKIYASPHPEEKAGRIPPPPRRTEFLDPPAVAATSW